MKIYRKTKLDANQAEVIDHVKKHGGLVTVLGEPVDTYMHLGSFGGFVEIKVKGRTMYTRKQLHWISESGPIPVAIAKSGEDAVEFLKTRKGLTQEQKNWLAIFLVGNTGKMWTDKQIERVINA